jgi:hypothetical protein
MYSIKGWFGAATLVVCALLSAGVAGATPVSNCIAGIDAGHFSCVLFESDALGNPSDISNIILIPAGAIPISAGYLVLMDSGDPNNVGDESNQSLWSNVVNFIDLGNGTSSSLQLLSRGCNIATNNTSCFPSFATVNNALNDFELEPPSGIFVYNPEGGANPTQNHTYTITSSPGAAPEPATLGLIGSALVGLAFGRKALSRRRP